jgi:hypothetical protein
MNLTSQELAKVRKAAIYSFTLSSEMKTSVVDVRLKELAQEIKKHISKNYAFVDVVCLRGNP